MAGMLTVVNPRRRRRKARRTHKARSSRRHKRHLFAAANPRRHRRRRVRRHHNPFGGGLNVQGFIKGVTGVGVGAVGARIVSNLVKNQFFPTASPAMKIGIEAGVGILSGLVIGKMLKQPALGAGIAAGAAVVVALDIYDLFIKGMLPPLLQDYQYGTMQDYQTGTLNGWAPQPGMSGDAGIYEDGVYN
jgi:hypothetical protein